MTVFIDFNFVTKEKVVDIGPIEIKKEEAAAGLLVLL